MVNPSSVGGIVQLLQPHPLYSVGQDAIPSSDVAKVIGMLLQIGMEQLDRLVTVPGVVQVKSEVPDDEELGVEADGVEGDIKIPLELYCDDGGKAFEGSALSLQSSLDNFSVMLCMFRMTFKASSVGVSGPYLSLIHISEPRD